VNILNSAQSPQRIVEQYIEYSNIEGQSKLDGDCKIGNKMSKKLTKLEAYLEDNNDLAKIVLKELIKSNSIRARTLASVESLRLDMYVEESLKVLEEISNNEELGILSFGAEISLKIWKEKGYLEP